METSARLDEAVESKEEIKIYRKIIGELNALIVRYERQLGIIKPKEQKPFIKPVDEKQKW